MRVHLHSLHAATELLQAAADACFLATNWFIADVNFGDISQGYPFLKETARNVLLKLYTN